MPISDENLALIKAMIEKNEANLRSIKQLLNNHTGEITSIKPGKKGPAVKKTAAGEPGNGEDNIIEGQFNGQEMIGDDGKTYPIPANYASKSKLIQGDRLKLTIQPDGSYLYKQIGPVERIHLIGPLIYEDNQYKVLANNRSYKVLLASVTYYKAEIGHKVALIVPVAHQDAEWGAIDHVLPKDISINGDSADDDLF